MSSTFCEIVRCLLPGRNLVQIWYNIDYFFKAHFQDCQAIPILSRKEFEVMFRVGLHIATLLNQTSS